MPRKVWRPQPGHAGADLRFKLAAWRFFCLELMRKHLERPIGGAAAAKLIDRGVSERAIEPRHHRVVRRQTPVSPLTALVMCPTHIWQDMPLTCRVVVCVELVTTTGLFICR